MLKEFCSVCSCLLRVQRMSSVGLGGRQLCILRKLSFANTFLIPTNFTRKISFSMVFSNVNTSAEVESILTDHKYNDMVRHIYRCPGMGHNLLVIQPRVRFGPKGETVHSAELKLSEAVALVETLPDWKVVKKCIIPVQSVKTKLIFGKGNLESIISLLQTRPDISGIFIGVNLLTAAQNVKLEEHFAKQVFDRYQIVLQIFRAHAHTKEAKLQIALAEIPYLRVKLCEFSFTYNADIFTAVTNISRIGGSGETFVETRRRLLNERQVKLKRALDKLKKQRDFLRQSEGRKSYPIVAVVGYTNCGKTTLIKALTKDNRLKPENKLFATLDVTLHAGFLPSSQKVLYIDTIGFISDVPISLIQAFKATLEDVALADVIVHVRDISHPDSESQKTVVLETLRSLNLSDSLMESIIEVGNKVDLIDCDEVNDGLIPISATEGINLQKLSEVIEERILENTNRRIKILRVPNGGEEYRWLYKEATVRDVVADETDYNYLIVEVIISEANYAKFTHNYGDLSISLPHRT